MTKRENDNLSQSRRSLLKIVGGTALAPALAGCPESSGDATETAPSTATEERTATPTTTDTVTEEADETQSARVYGVDPSLVAEESTLVQSTYLDFDYRRLTEGLGSAGTADGTRVTHLLGYGHDLPDIEGSPPERPTLHPLSAGVVSTPAVAADTRTAQLVEAPLPELIRRPEDNLLLATMGLGRSVEWLQQPLSLRTGSVQSMGTEATTQTFVGALRAEAGPGLQPREDRGYLLTLNVARMTRQGDAVVFGMVNAWERPPTMGPPPTELGPEIRDLLADIYERVDRAALFRRSLGRYFGVAGAIPDEDERPPPPEKESRSLSYSTTIGLDRPDQIELGYPNESVHSDTVLNIFTVGRNAPGLFSGETYDPDQHSRGTKYYVTADTQATAYPLGGDETFPFGVIASPQVQIEGEERNPLATRNLTDLATAFDGVWDLLGWVRDTSDLDWVQGPQTFSPAPSPQLLGNSATVVGLRGTMAWRPSGGGSRQRGDVDVYVARVRTGTEVVIAIAVNANTGGGYWVRPASAARLFAEGVPRVVTNPNAPSQWVDASVDSLDLVQVVSNTRLERAGGDAHQQPDPPLMEGRNTAPPFDFSTFSGTAFDGFNPAYGVFSFDIAGQSISQPWTVVSQSDLKAVDEDTRDPDRVFHDAARDSDPDTDLPVFELASNHSSVTLSAHAPSGYQYDETSIQQGSAYTTTGEKILRVGFISVVDPDNGTNYGDSNGTTTSYQNTVDAAFEYLRRAYPTGIAAYRHDSFLAGNRTENKDYKDARVALERIADPSNNNWSYSGQTMAHGTSVSNARQAIRNNGFDVWVLIVPNRYYQWHNNNSRPTGLAPHNDLFAVTAVEGARTTNVSAAETTAQEIGHRLSDDQYDDPRSGGGEDYPLAQRDSDGSDTQLNPSVSNIDYDHARRVDNSPAGPDPPGLVSRAYSLADGQFGVPNGHSYDSSGYSIDGPPAGPRRGGSRTQYGAQNLMKRIGRVESYMSYSGWNTWADSIITELIATSDLNRDARNFRTSTILASVFADSGESGDAGSGTIEMRELQSFDGWLYGTDEQQLADAENPITITLHDPAGTEVRRTRAVEGVGIDGDGVDDTELENVVVFDIEWPEQADELRISRGGEPIRVNPITRAIRDAVADLPDAAFATEPAMARERITALRQEIDEAMQAGEYGQARVRLEEYADGQLQEDFDQTYEPQPNELASARFLVLVERLLGRLEALAAFEA